MRKVKIRIKGTVRIRRRFAVVTEGVHAPSVFYLTGLKRKVKVQLLKLLFRD